MLLPVALLFASVAPSLSWTEDNYAKALEQARSRRVPLFVEVWAPW